MGKHIAFLHGLIACILISIQVPGVSNGDKSKSSSDNTVANPQQYVVGSTVQICWKEDDTNKALSVLQEILTKHHLSVRVEKHHTDSKYAYLSPAGPHWQSLLLHVHSMLGDPLCIDLSKRMDTPVLAFLEYQQDCWGYALFRQGKLLNYFWNDPSIPEEDPKICKGDAHLLAQLFHVESKLLDPYLHFINHNDNRATSRKAFNDDQFTLGDHWVRIDFMRRLGIIYPDFQHFHGLTLYIPEQGVNME